MEAQHRHPVGDGLTSYSANQPDRAGQDDVGVVPGLGDEEVDHAVELELVECLASEVRVR